MIPPLRTIRAQESRDSKAGVSSGSGSILGDDEFHDGIMEEYIEHISGWWFGTFVIFHNIWDNPSRWLSYFSRWLKPLSSIEHRSISDWLGSIGMDKTSSNESNVHPTGLPCWPRACSGCCFFARPFCLMIFSWGLNVAQRGSTANQYCYADFWLPWPCSHFANVEPCPANLMWRASESQTSIGRTQSTQWFSRQACYCFGCVRLNCPGDRRMGAWACAWVNCVSKKHSKQHSP